MRNLMGHYRQAFQWAGELISRLIKPWPDPVLPFGRDDPGVRIYVFGTAGSIPGRQKNQTSSYLIEKGGGKKGTSYRIAIDAGTGLFVNYPPNRNLFDEIDAMAITHLHPDHIGDLDQFAVGVAYGPRGVVREEVSPEQRYRRKTIYGPRGTANYVRSRINAHPEAILMTEERIQQAFKFIELDYPSVDDEQEALLTWPRYQEDIPAGIRFTAVPVLHLIKGERDSSRPPAFGYRLEINQDDGGRPLVVAFSGDTIAHPNLEEIGRDADFYVCDVGGPPVHMTAEEAGHHAYRAGARVLAGTHTIPWRQEPPGRYEEDMRRFFSGRIEMLMSGTCFFLTRSKLSFPINLDTGQEVSEEEYLLFRQGMNHNARQYYPRGIELRTPKDFPDDPAARLKLLSSRRFLLLSVLTPRWARRTMERLATRARDDRPLHLPPRVE